MSITHEGSVAIALANSTLDRAAGSQSLVAAGQRERWAATEKASEWRGV